MGHFSMEKSLNPGSVLGGNQHAVAQSYSSIRVRLTGFMSNPSTVAIGVNSGRLFPKRWD
jgi:hypothetical protein